MTGGTENRKKTIIAACLGVVALGCVIYGYNALFGGSSAPPPAPAPVAATSSTTGTRIKSNGNSSSGQTSAQSTSTSGGAIGGLGAAPGIAATKMASTSSSLDPTLDESSMLRTESLVYSGTGRNIFSLVYTPPAPVAPRNLPPARPNPTAVVAPPVPTGPPPPPPINLKFFGTAVRANGLHQAFLLSGEDVYLASQGDIVARKYKILTISSGSIQVEDLVNHNAQTLPLQTN